jgi:hypothetical protein
MFFENHFNERKNLVRDYSIAKDEVQQLKVHCRALGFEIEEPNFPPEDEKDSLDHSKRYTRNIVKSGTTSNTGLVRHNLGNGDPSQSQFQGNNSSSVLSQHQENDSRTSTKVQNWLNTLHAGERPDPGQHEDPVALASPSLDLASTYPANGSNLGSSLNLDLPSLNASFWTDREAEAFLPLPNHQMHNSSSRAASISTGSHISAWKGDAPRNGRRYSEPSNGVVSITTTDIFPHEKKP